MKTALIIPLALCAVIMASCSASFNAYELADSYATSLHYQPAAKGAGAEEEDLPKGVLASSYYNGDLLGGAIWWKRRGLKIFNDEEFEVRADSAVNIPFGSTFPPLDFMTEKVQLKVTARAISMDGGDPTLQLQMVDDRGFRTNATPPVNVIASSDDFIDYYFDVEGIYTQILPEPKKVNGGFINSVEFYVNPEGPAFYGKILIEEIKVVKKEETATN